MKLVLAVAVAVALTAGSAEAVSRITSAQIQDRTIQVRDLAPSTVKYLRGQRGPIGPAGDTGDSGASGPSGPAGGFDPAKVTYVQGGDVSVPVGAVGSASAACPAGSVAISGGFTSSIGNVGATVTVTNGFAVVVWNDRSVAITISAYAVCGRP